MIDLRYHIVSIMAVFLALGLGILLGSSVVSSPLEARLHDDLNDARNQRREAQAEAATLKKERDDLFDRIESEIAPWAAHSRLDGASIVLVVDAPEAPEWREHVLDALVSAGAKTPGTISLTQRFDLTAPEDETDLVTRVQGVVPSFEPGDDAAAATLDLLGRVFVEEEGRALVDELASAGFLSLQGARDEQWPAADSTIVLLSSARAADVKGPSAARFARNVAEIASILVVTDNPDGASAVADLRVDGGTLPDNLATFDSGTDMDDPGGLGVTAALLAAIEARGGNFGAGRGLSFMAPPSPN